jgi:predicted 3-demethylubiquinone-9 3-methyltransferase (glyoxalase superfamily)
MSKITPFLWFDYQAEEAANFYAGIFKNSKILNVSPGPNGVAFTVNFILEGQEFIALNAGPVFKFNEAVSFFVDCKTQDEVDELWAKLSAGGEEGQCAWVKDKFGLWWQIVPSVLGELLGDPDPVKSQRVMDAMLKMKKIIIADLKQAYDQA